MPTHPRIDEYDLGSYLVGGLSRHAVEKVSEKGLQLDGTCEGFYDESLDGHTFCKACAFNAVHALGYVGPVPVPVSYQHWLSLEVEPLMLKFSSGGHLLAVASYQYGRCCFDPGEPRTNLCDNCGVETLVENESWA